MRNSVFLTALWVMVLASASSLCAAKDRYADTAAVARKEATAALALESNGVFSVTTAVMVDGRIVYAEAFGMIGSDRSTPSDTETQFNAGSISKVFTAVAMLRLRDQGRIDLDKPVVHYLPHFRMNDKRYRQITIRTLLDHTSGMPGTNYYQLFGSKENPAYVTETLALLRDSALKSNPGDINVYCNDCFTVAQAVIERVSGMHAGNPGDATPYGLSNRYRTRMILQYETDLVELEIIHKDGRRVLRAGAFEFTDAEFVPPLQQFEQIVIGPSGGNVVRRVVSGTSFKSSVPADGRILIYAPNGTTTFDSLFGGNKTVDIAPGSFIVFIGDPATVFVAQTT